jgi:hypothetical protein
MSIELLLEAVGPLALLGVEVLGYSKMLEEALGVFLLEDSVIAGDVFMANRLRACLARLGCLVHSSLCKGHCHRRQRRYRRTRSRMTRACPKIDLGGRATRRTGDK